MPLIQGKSKQSFSKNVGTEMDAGKPQKQSLAIAYNIMRKNRAKKMAVGGIVENEDLDPKHEPEQANVKEFYSDDDDDDSEDGMAHGGMLMHPKSMAEMIHMKRMSKGGMYPTPKDASYADGGEVDEPMDMSADDEDIDTQPDEVVEDNDFTANGPDAQPQDSSKKRRGLLIGIMNALHDDHYGK